MQEISFRVGANTFTFLHLSSNLIISAFEISSALLLIAINYWSYFSVFDWIRQCIEHACSFLQFSELWLSSVLWICFGFILNALFHHLSVHSLWLGECDGVDWLQRKMRSAGSSSVSSVIDISKPFLLLLQHCKLLYFVKCSPNVPNIQVHSQYPLLWLCTFS